MTQAIPKKIVHVIIGLNVGGAEIALERLVNGRKNHTHQRFKHTVISLMDVGPIGRRLHESGVCVHAMGLTGPMSLPKVFWRLRSLLMELNPDIVQTWMYHADLIGGFAAYSSGIKNVIWNVRSSDITKGGSRQTLFVRRICAMISRIIPQKIVFVGRRSQILHCDLGYDESRSTVITNGFSLTLLNVLPIKTAAFRSQLRLTDDNLLVGFVGRAEFIKGPDIFIKAMAPLFAQFSNLIVLMVGRGMTTENQDLVRWLGETGYPERFRILGQRNDVPVCLSAMDVFCLSSRSEGFPNALGEAMLMGLPCVTTDVGDARFLVGTSGIVVPNEDVAKLSIAIDKLLSLKPQERTLLGKDSQNRIKDRFSLERFLMNFEAIYDEVLTPMKVR